MEVIAAKPPEWTISIQNIMLAIKYMDKIRLLPFCSGDCIIYFVVASMVSTHKIVLNSFCNEVLLMQYK